MGWIDLGCPGHNSHFVPFPSRLIVLLLIRKSITSLKKHLEKVSDRLPMYHDDDLISQNSTTASPTNSKGHGHGGHPPDGVAGMDSVVGDSDLDLRTDLLSHDPHPDDLDVEAAERTRKRARSGSRPRSRQGARAPSQEDSREPRALARLENGHAHQAREHARERERERDREAATSEAHAHGREYTQYTSLAAQERSRGTQWNREVSRR